MKILTIDFQSSDYGKVLVESLHHTGFAIIENHPISHTLINEVYTTWNQFFSSDIKNNYMFHPEKQDGYFPMLSEHAKGYAPVGEVSILIAVGSGHREEAFKICRYILEEVKHQSPIWKKEHYADGKEEWLPGHSLRPKKQVK